MFQKSERIENSCKIRIQKYSKTLKRQEILAKFRSQDPEIFQKSERTGNPCEISFTGSRNVPKIWKGGKSLRNNVHRIHKNSKNLKRQEILQDILAKFRIMFRRSRNIPKIWKKMGNLCEIMFIGSKNVPKIWKNGKSLWNNIHRNISKIWKNGKSLGNNIHRIQKHSKNLKEREILGK